MMKTPTKRQSEIIDLMGDGHSNKEIAFRLGLSERTIFTYASQLYRKFPEMGRRYGAAKIKVRDHERQMAIRLDQWVQHYKEQLDATALAEVKAIVADQVAPFLR